MRPRALRFRVWLSAGLLILAGAALAAISLSTTTPITQSFDGIGTTATATLPADFRVDKPSTVRTVGSYAAAATATTLAGGANLSGTASNGIYNFGSGTTTTGPDRAVGFLSSGTATQSGNLYVQLTNSTGASLSGLQISYAVEKYRGGSNPAGFRFQLFYSSDGTSWTSAGSDFLTSFAADAANSGFTPAPGATINVNAPLNVSIADGSQVYLAWNYSVASGTTTTNAQALAIDDISILGLAAGENAPSVQSTTPANGATNVAVNSTIAINFSESVTASASAFSLECPAGSPRTFTQTASPATTFTLTPSSPLPAGTTCAVNVTASQVTDTDPTDPPDTMAADFPFSFTTASPVGDTAPSVISVSPANLATGVPVDTNIVISFSESVAASASAFTIQCGGSPQTFDQSASPSVSFTLNPTSDLPSNTTCTVTVTANEISDTDANDPPDSMTSDVAFSFATPPPGAGKVMINEIDADTPGSDTAEFVELYDGGVGNTPLDGLVVVFYDGDTGSSKASYAAFDLDGYSTDANGYFVMGNPGVAGASLIFDPGQFGLLQNGPDAVGLYIGNATDYPAGTNATTTNLLDAVVYGTDDPNASGLLPLLNAGQPIANENAAGNSQTQSNQRCPNGQGGFRNTTPYYPGAPTPGSAEQLPGGPAAERRRDQSAVRRRRELRRSLSERLRRAVQPRHWPRRPHGLVAAVRVSDWERLGFQQAAARRNDRSR